MIYWYNLLIICISEVLLHMILRTKSAPTSPGPSVTAIADTSFIVILASSNAFFITTLIASTCILDAISGTTPPYFSCSSICEFIIFE